MSAKSTPSPPQGPVTQVDESSLPQGHCRYILLLPEIKGQRCACVNFTLNRGLPGATCDCGHLACFHNKEAEPSEMDLLKQRIKELEERYSGQDATARDRDDDASQAILARVSGLEEEVERSREEFSQEIKRAFSNSTLAWNSFQHVQRKVEGQELQMNHVLNRLAGVDAVLQRLDDRQLELQDADTYLEERIEYIQETLDESEKPHTRGRDPRPRGRSMSGARTPNGLNHPLGALDRPLGETLGPSPSSANPDHSDASTLDQPVPTPQPTRTGSVSAASGIWTVHISLLPHATIPMPFERNTNAYQRCLSRGLHQVVPIRGPSAEAFCAAVNKAFGSLLRGRPWMPLQAELCNAEQLQGLPMLRQLEPHLIDEQYDAEFLRKNCAVCDANGMMESLYITMREPHALSWHAVRRAPIFTEGLEESWEFDPLLDNDPYDDDDIAVDDDNRPAAGDIVPTLPSLKRTASEMHRSSSFGSATAATPAVEGVLPRAKRTCPLPAKANTIVDLRRPGVGTA
ncbi:hypothetical protein BR93DRAFT_494664 [Coniochaeta sp. PMI_546]|nr:hypothetical protein BR93DRAFT_494664 [Coniochaeta sp. PMI_546]